MTSDREIAARALEMQNSASDYSLGELPGYWDWCKNRQAVGIPQEILAELDSTCTWLLPADAAKFSANNFDEFLEDLLNELGEDELLDTLQRSKLL